MKAKPPLEVADIFRHFGEQYLQSHSVSAAEKRVLRAIQLCRTEALGGHIDACDECGHMEISYNSCANRHCPKCQAEARAEWFKARQRDLLPVHYFHIIFTIPEDLRHLAFQNKKTVYGILFRAAAETLRQVAKKHLGAEIGFFAVLHTWGQALTHHPHVHLVVPGGGLCFDKSTWISASKRFFLPLKALKIIFRAKFLDYLEQAFKNGKLSFHGPSSNLAHPRVFKALLIKLSKYQWAVQAKPPFAGPEQVLKYLARYTHRVAFSNARLISLRHAEVTFRWKDYSDGHQHKLMTLDVFEFIRRFLLHVLPTAFVRIRYYGFLSNRNRKQSLQLCRKLLGEQQSTASDDDSAPANDSTAEEQQQGEDRHFRRCPVCKKGRMILVEEFAPRPDSTISTSPLQQRLDTS